MATRQRTRPDPRTRAIYLRRRAVALAVLAAIVTALVVVLDSGGGGQRGGRRLSAHRVRPRQGRASSRGSLRRPVAAFLPALPPLSLTQLAGQRIIYAYSGLTPPPSLLAAIRAGEAAGVILFSPNVATAEQTRAVVERLQQASAAGPVHAPLLILTDQEGGEVRRMPGEPALSERQIGQSSDAAGAAAEAGRGAARTLGAAGVNVNLSPVLDVYRRPDNFIDQFQRSYSTDARRAAALGGAFIAAQQRHGVAAAAKHFPGLGAARRGQDTDSRPVTLRVSRAELRAVDEAPYRAAIAAGVKLVMTSWAVYPALDPAVPAGLSARVVQGELRDRLGFQGVTITDTLSATALSAYGTLAERGRLAARAGADLLICSAVNGDDDPSGGLSVLQSLVGAMGDGQISRAAAEQSARRVLALRMSLR